MKNVNKKNFSILVITFIFSIFLINPNIAFANSNLQTINDNNKNEAIPSKYDPRFNMVTSIKDQGQLQVCWSFAGLSTLESKLLKDGYGSYDLSEEHLRWWASSDSSGYGWMNVDASSGNTIMTTPGYLISGAGPKSENDFTYGSYSRPANFYTAKTLFDVTGIIYIGAHDDNEVKRQIIKNGAVTTTLYIDQNLINTNGSYYDFSTGCNHAVSIVGWDDNYSVNNFGYYRPSKPGAWLVKNSWGTYGLSDQGYLWISYDDKSILNEDYNYAINEVSPHDEDRQIYQYDTEGANVDWSPFNNCDQTFINQYDFTEDTSLESVIFESNSVGSKYEIYYQDTNVNSKPDSSLLKMTKLSEGTIDYRGYRQIKINPYKIKKGRGAIAVRIYDTSQNVKSSIGAAVNSYYAGTNQYAYRVNTVNAKCYVLSNGNLVDLVNQGNLQGSVLSIKAITNKAIQDNDLQNQEIENGNAENKNTDNQEIENGNAENKDAENKDIENKDIDNGHAQNEDIDNGDTENEDADNQDIDNKDVENEDINNDDTENQHSFSDNRKLRKIKRIIRNYNDDKECYEYFNDLFFLYSMSEEANEIYEILNEIKDVELYKYYLDIYKSLKEEILNYKEKGDFERCIYDTVYSKKDSIDDIIKFEDDKDINKDIDVDKDINIDKDIDKSDDQSDYIKEVDPSKDTENIDNDDNKKETSDNRIGLVQLLLIIGGLGVFLKKQKFR